MVQAYTGTQRDVQRPNDARTPEADRRPDAPGSGILGAVQRDHRSASEETGRVPGGTSCFQSLFLAGIASVSAAIVAVLRQSNSAQGLEH
jgi:hypothetical protein